MWYIILVGRLVQLLAYERKQLMTNKQLRVILKTIKHILENEDIKKAIHLLESLINEL